MSDEFFMRRAIALASRARGTTSPNPMVGALIVRNNRIVAEGYHRRPGTPHAEAIALERAGEKTRGATLYVSLEPCCHKDKRTPPCTGSIISSGISRVVVAMQDPNPKVSGKGIKELNQAGIKVSSGVLEDKARELNEFYLKHVTTGMPFVIMKVAMTLDGKIATPEGESKWITGERSRRAVHRIRGAVDALMTAIGTVKADNPRLTSRLKGARNPMRIIIDPDLETEFSWHVAATPPETIIVTRRPGKVPGESGLRAAARAEDKRRILSDRGVEIIEYEGAKVDLVWLMKALGRRDVMSVLIEGGASLNAYCLENKIVDKVMFFIAPKIIGGERSFPAVGGKSLRRLEDAYRIKDVKIRRFDEDILIEGYLES